MNRCTKCILPENYPGITFDEEGVCNYCTASKKRKYRGDKALKDKIESILQATPARNESCSCVLALSGGRDSSYLLYYLVKVLGFRVLAYSVDNGFVPEQTKLNMKNMVDELGMELVIEENDRLIKCLRHHMLSWMHKPSPAMIGMLCTGCRLGIDVGVTSFARLTRIPIVVQGSTPLESDSFKRKIVSTDPTREKGLPFVLGYLSQVVVNPRWVSSPTCTVTQIREYYHHYYLKKSKQQDPTWILPFHSYIRWEETKIISTIEQEFNWRKNPKLESTWRGDCDIATLKLYLYGKTLGFNDKDDGLSYLVRDGQLTREEALKRREKEGQVPDEVIRNILDRLGLRFSDLQVALKKAS
jgi:hypothetical protein